MVADGAPSQWIGGVAWAPDPVAALSSYNLHPASNHPAKSCFQSSCSQEECAEVEGAYGAGLRLEVLPGLTPSATCYSGICNYRLQATGYTVG